jgi:transposase
MIMSCDDELSRRLVPDDLSALVEPLIPPGKTRPQGGGMSRVNDRAVFTAIVFVLTSGCAWQYLPPSFGVTVPTAHRRFAERTAAGLRPQVRQAATISPSSSSPPPSPATRIRPMRHTLSAHSIARIHSDNRYSLARRPLSE